MVTFFHVLLGFTGGGGGGGNVEGREVSGFSNMAFSFEMS
jgi:hypothetical protein